MSNPSLSFAASIRPGGASGPVLRGRPVRDPAVHTAVFLQDLVLDSKDVDQFLNTLAGVAAEYLAVPRQEMYCGVTPLRPHHAKTFASSNHAALKLDKIQHTFDDGPCLTAARTHELVHVPDIQTDHRWPAYLQKIAAQGIRSTLSVPIFLDGEANCALNLYSNTIDGFTAEAIASAQDFANEASRSLRLALRIARLADKAENPTAALKSRTTIDQATGILMRRTSAASQRRSKS